MRERPDLRIRMMDVSEDHAARDRLIALAKEKGVVGVGVPAFHVAGRLIVGFDASGSTEAEVRGLLPPRRSRPDSARADSLPPSASGLPAIDTKGDALEARPPPPAGRTGAVTLPIVGVVDVERVGLPVFSFAVGFVDGVNPCAMWALLYLLTLLAPLRDRRRMFAIGATFVFVGGLLYYAFLAAWLEFFLLVGLSRTLQVVLGSVALLAAAVHLKDFVAFGTGPSLSIPESAKPGIYRRARRIVTAEHLAAALAAVVILSALVNVVELLCTAGLPALYTQVLSTHELSRPAYYGNLGLYVGAYILDDSIVLAVGIVTLSQKRLQERAGRWLKLVSGLVLGALGAVLLLRPEWLQ
ncbi:MAG: NrdH-redoxin [Gemmatimonadetes bacterium]|nr:NrdH-redoxin [Gemmatimonadota bacterium]